MLIQLSLSEIIGAVKKVNIYNSQPDSEVMNGIISFSDKIISMTEFWLIRHGQTDWNIQGRYQGQSDIPLNETGFAQARQLAQSLDGAVFDAIFSSDLSRARQTAEQISIIKGIPIQVDHRLREICQGEWEGQTIEAIKKRFAKQIDENQRDPLHAHAPGGETTLNVAQRLADFANTISERYPHQRLLVVSHGFALATLICQARSISLLNVHSNIPDNAVPEIVFWPPTHT